jgi:predicted DNA-binding protein
MATTKRRIHVSLPKELENALVDLSVLMERPMASIVTELLVESLPALIQIADSLRSVKSGKLNIEGFEKILEQGKKDIELIQDDLKRSK